MDQGAVLDIGNSALYLIAYLAAPMLLSALAVGLLISILQAATQIQEQTLTFIPKLIAMAIALVFLGPWMVQMWVTFTQNLFNDIPSIIG